MKIKHMRLVLPPRMKSGAVHDARLRRIIDRNFDDVDAEQRGAIVTWRFVVTTFQFFFITNTAGTGVVHNERIVFGRAGND